MEQATETPAAQEQGATETKVKDAVSGIDSFKHENGMIFGKFKDEAALADAYRNLEKEFHKKNPTAPENYDLKIDDKFKDKWEFKNDDPLLKSVLPIFKKANLSNDVVNELVNAFVEANVSTFVDPKEELAKLGGDGEKIIGEIAAFSKKSGIDITKYVVTAEDAKLFHSLIQRTRDQNIPTNLDKGQGKTSEELLNEAFDYQKKHASTISSNKEQQAKFFELLQRAGENK